jgi:hypothetical protein
VSCTSPTICTTVGFSNADGTTVAAVWDGLTWANEVTPNPSGAAAILSAVSCTPTEACTAVGSTGSPSGTLAERSAHPRA